MKDGGVAPGELSGTVNPLQSSMRLSFCFGLRSKRFFVVKPSGADRPGCKLGVSLLLPPSLHYLGTLRNIFLCRRSTWA